MAELRKYRLRTAQAADFIEKNGGVFGFTLRFEKPGRDGGLIIMGQDKCPILELDPAGGGVVSTTNEFAQQCISGMVVPNKTFRNGQNRASDRTKLFDDVTHTGQPVDLDLDPIFDAVPTP